MLVIIGILTIIVVGQWILIWRLLDRLLVQAHVPSLGPVRTTPPLSQPQRPDTRKKLFTVNVDQ